jgi:hypothetical protein
MEYVRNLRKRKRGYVSIKGMGEEIEVEALPSDCSNFSNPLQLLLVQPQA